MIRRRLAIACAVCSVLLGACQNPRVPDSTPSPMSSSSVPSPVSSAGAALGLGAWAQPRNGHGRTQQMAAVTDLESLLGHKLAIDHFYVPRLAPVSTWDWRLQWDLQQSRTPMVSLGFGADTRRVAAGDFDPILRSYAEAIRAEHGTVLIRYAYEMDGVKNVSWVHSGPDFIAAWRHVHQLFQGTPVQWVWSPNAPAFAGKNGGVQQYWPGDDVVDWVAADGYNFFTCEGSRREWRTFEEIFDPFLAWGSEKSKPLMVAEFGSLQDPDNPQRQKQWLENAMAQASRHPQLRALVYFNSDGQGCNWRLDSSSDTKASLLHLGGSSALDLTAVVRK